MIIKENNMILECLILYIFCPLMDEYNTLLLYSQAKPRKQTVTGTPPELFSSLFSSSTSPNKENEKNGCQKY